MRPRRRVSSGLAALAAVGVILVWPLLDGSAHTLQSSRLSTRLRDGLTKARSDLKKAEAELKDLRDITHDAEPLPYAEAAVRDAATRVETLTRRFKEIDRAFQEVLSLPADVKDDLDDCRGVLGKNAQRVRVVSGRRRSASLSARSSSGIGARAGQRCGVRPARAPDEAGSHRIRKEVAHGGPAPTEGGDEPASVDKAAAQVARIKTGSKAAAKAVASAKADLARCQRGSR